MTVATPAQTGWIETIAFTSQRRTSWIIKIDDQIVHQEDLDGDDASGMKAHDVAAEWTRTHHPNVSFTWKHSNGDVTGRLPRIT